MILFSGRQIGQIFRQSGYKKCFQQLPLPFKNCLVKKKKNIYMNSSPRTELNRRRALGSMMTGLTASPFSRLCPRVVKRGCWRGKHSPGWGSSPRGGGMGRGEGRTGGQASLSLKLMSSHIRGKDTCSERFRGDAELASCESKLSRL